MGFARLLAVLLAACVAAASGQSQVPAEKKGSAPQEVSFPLEHAFGLTQPFILAGNFTARANFDRAGTGAVRLSHIRLVRRSLSDQEIEEFKALMGKDGIYRVQLPADVFNPEEQRVTTWLPARCLADSGLQESFVLHMDEGGSIVSLEYGQPGGGCRTRSEGPVQLPARVMLRSSVTAKFAKDAPRLAIGPVRVTPEYVDDPAMGVDDPARDAQEAAEGKKGFFQKYWYIIVPMMLVNILGGGAAGAADAKASAKPAGGARPAAKG